jgi:hypothetical protein
MLDATKTAHVYRINGRAVAGWYRHGEHWISFAVDDGRITDVTNCGSDEHDARTLALAAARMRAGVSGVITLEETAPV